MRFQPLGIAAAAALIALAACNGQTTGERGEPPVTTPGPRPTVEAGPDRPSTRDAAAPADRPSPLDLAIDVTPVPLDALDTGPVDLNTGPCVMPNGGLGIDSTSTVWVEPSLLGADAVADRLVKWLFRTGPQADVTARVAGCRSFSAAHVRALADQLLVDPRAQTGLFAQFQTWLVPGGLAHLQSSTPADAGPPTGPAVSPELRASMLEELGRFGQHAVNSGASFETLLTAPYSLIDGRLAALYGIAGSEATAPFALVPFAFESQRSGVLTMAAVTSVAMQAGRHNPPGRGRLIAERLLCTEVPDPPEGAAPPLATLPYPNMTVRQSLEANFAVECRPCHVMLDAGWALERFDALGRLRGDDNGLPIDSHAELIMLPNEGIRRRVDAPRALGLALAQAIAARDCFVDHMFAIAVGFDRPLEGRERSPTTATLRDRFRQGGNLRDLLLDIASTADFHLQRR